MTDREPTEAVDADETRVEEAPETLAPLTSGAPASEPVWIPYVVVRPWDHGTLYTCSICDNRLGPHPDFPTREAAEIHIRSHQTTTA